MYFSTEIQKQCFLQCNATCLFLNSRLYLKTFVFSGGKVSFLKAYASHTVCYEGKTKGAQMAGHWWFDTNPECKGDWAIWPATA